MRRSEQPALSLVATKPALASPSAPAGSEASKLIKPCIDGSYCWVYFVECIDGPIKIGLTSQLVDRLRGLQVGNHRPLEVYAAHPYKQPLAKEIEKLLHSLFRPHVIGGEWFEPHAEVLKAAVDPYEYVRPILEARERNRRLYPEMFA